MTIKGVFRSIPKWWRMLCGNDSLHVAQDIGKAYSLTELCGYYNDMTLKISDKSKLSADGIPVVTLATGETVFSYVTIAQYGLGLVDLFLLKNEKKYLDGAEIICDFLLKKQDKNGGWGVDLLAPEREYYSAMAQGEAISLMLRAGKYAGTDRYLDAVKAAYMLLVKEVSEGGCAIRTDKRLELYEYTDYPLVLNGSVFALWGIYDYVLCFDDEAARSVLNLAAKTIADDLPKYDAGFWSKYTCTDMLASPFYHKLHIAQLTVLDEQFPGMGFGESCGRLREYERSFFKREKAFFLKALQKIKSDDGIAIVK